MIDPTTLTAEERAADAPSLRHRLRTFAGAFFALALVAMPLAACDDDTAVEDAAEDAGDAVEDATN